MNKRILFLFCGSVKEILEKIIYFVSFESESFGFVLISVIIKNHY